MTLHESNTLIVVSHYQARPKKDLELLLEQLKHVAQDVMVVINDDHHKGPGEFLSHMQTTCIRRENKGMNISGWNEAILRAPDYGNYIFLQDECQIRSYDFLKHYESKLHNEKIGLIGECLNPRWSYPWHELEQVKFINAPVQITPNAPPILRIPFYFACMKDWGIDPGKTGRHLRSLIWGISRRTIEKIQPFPMGRIKEECIAAEVAVSKMVEQAGLLVEQADTTPFQFISHKEWKLDGISKST